MLHRLLLYLSLFVGKINNILQHIWFTKIWKPSVFEYGIEFVATRSIEFVFKNINAPLTVVINGYRFDEKSDFRGYRFSPGATKIGLYGEVTDGLLRLETQLDTPLQVTGFEVLGGRPDPNAVLANLIADDFMVTCREIPVYEFLVGRWEYIPRWVMIKHQILTPIAALWRRYQKSIKSWMKA